VSEVPRWLTSYKGRTIFTIGHSTRTLEELILVLKHYGVERLIDIRHYSTSRHNPQFDRSALEQALPARNIEYYWFETLGGYREGGYLAYTGTQDFHCSLDALERFARTKPTAYMCAEVKWFQCHRRHVSDALAARGWKILNIIDEKRADAHRRKTNRIKCD
jgi:uncharacterized protein (DUF488 family)